MFPLSVNDIILGMAASIFILGVLSVGAGVVILVSRVMGNDIQSIAQQTAKLAQKGITDDVSGLVGNASSLISSLNELVRTTSGVGIFLILTGFMMIAASYVVILQIK